MITVIIPYYQRESGILAKALNSVFESQGVSDVHIIVVDDESPVPARDELGTFSSMRYPVTVIEQVNAGPGGARNTALDNLPAETDYVAFLDSDDVWSPRHLQHALTALSSGYDVYFCDHMQLGSSVSAFRRAGRINPDQHPRIAGQPNLHAFKGDMFDQIVSGNVIGTSTVVFDVRTFSSLRFRTDLSTAGEDYLFWLELASSGASFSFGTVPEVSYGKGVNVYAGSGWGTEGHARRIVHELTYRHSLKAIYALTPRQGQIVEQAIAKLREGLVEDCLHRIVHRKRVDWRLLATGFRLDPRILASVYSVLAKMLLRVLRRGTH